MADNEQIDQMMYDAEMAEVLELRDTVKRQAAEIARLEIVLRDFQDHDKGFNE